MTAPASTQGDAKGAPQDSIGGGANTQSVSWYFIDANKAREPPPLRARNEARARLTHRRCAQAYRGPISKETLHFLFSTGAIDKHTYVFAEGFAPSRQWVKIRKLRDLYAQLQQPMPSQNQPALGVGQRPALQSPAQAKAPSPAAEPASGAPATSRLSEPEAPTPASQRNAMPMGFPSAGGGGNKISDLLAKAQATPRSARERPKTARRSFFRRKKKPPRYPFGTALGAVPVDDAGIPVVLAELRRLLWAGKGHLLEGIFRVSPGASTLQAMRTLAEAGQFDQIRDMESAAQMIKAWFGELPDSVLSPQLNPIVDGVPADGAQCARLVSEMPELNRKVVLWLLQLTADISRHEGDNRMTAQSMTIVLAPNLVRPPDSFDPLLALELNKNVVQVPARALRRRARARIDHSPRLCASVVAAHRRNVCAQFWERLYAHWNAAGGQL